MNIDIDKAFGFNEWDGKGEPEVGDVCLANGFADNKRVRITGKWNMSKSLGGNMTYRYESIDPSLEVGNTQFTSDCGFPFIAIKDRPKPKWVDGLPPVGVECEWLRSDDDWVAVKVIGYDGPACVFAVDGLGYRGATSPTMFRPIPSPRDAWVEKVDTMVKRIDGLTDVKAVAGYIHDALASGDLEVPK